MRPANRRALLVLFIMGGLALIWPLSAASSPIRLVIAVLTTVLIPGFVMTGVLYHPQSPFSWERIGLAGGLSIAVVVITGLLLQAGSTDLSANHWWFALIGTVLVGESLAWMRWRRVKQAQIPPTSYNVKSLTRSIIPLTLAGALLLAAYLVAQPGNRWGSQRAFTQLWIVPANQSAGNAGTMEVQLGVYNNELSRMHYRLEVTRNGKALATWQTIPLSSGSEWIGYVEVPTDSLAQVHVEASLYRLDDLTSPYRYVTLWLSVKDYER